MWIKEGDTVEVTVGDDNGERGQVLQIDRAAGKVVVKGVNMVYKHVRRSQRNPQGGRLHKEMPLQMSNVQVVCPSCGTPSRMGSRIAKDGSKERWCKSCKASTGIIAPPKEKLKASK